MKAILILVGKTQNKIFQTGIDDYINRINHYMPLQVKIIPELKNTKSISQDLQKQKEGELILKEITKVDTVVLFDEHGKEYRSVEFANWLKKQFNTVRNLIFIIGGAYGFSQEVYNRANVLISLSKMTFSHQMVRLICVEQIYRACTILKGEPYHHE